jgi:hypothetical protein
MAQAMDVFEQMLALWLCIRRLLKMLLESNAKNAESGWSCSQQMHAASIVPLAMQSVHAWQTN